MATLDDAAPRPLPGVHRSDSAVGWLPRRILALGIVAAMVWAIVDHVAFRAGEAVVSSFLLREVFGVASTPIQGEPLFFFQFLSGTELTVQGLQITLECTILLFLTPVALATAFVLATRRIPVGRVLAAGLAAAVFLFVVNQARNLMIAFSIMHWGRSGYEWSHVIVGSIVMLAALIAAGIIFVRICFLNRK